MMLDDSVIRGMSIGDYGSKPGNGLINLRRFKTMISTNDDDCELNIEEVI